MNKIIEDEINNHITIAGQLMAHCKQDIIRLSDAMIETYQKGNKILLFGNGGSAADAQHITADLVGRLSKDRRAFAAIALTANTSNLTAIGNDYGFDKIFERQVEALANNGDLLIGISTSGNSKNVINALQKGKEMGCICAGLTGEHKGLFNESCNITIHVPSSITTRIQEMHILIGHILCVILESKMV